MLKKELPLVALFKQEKLAFLFTRISTAIGARAFGFYKTYRVGHEV